MKDFVEDQGENGSLPLRGSIPDMFSDSKRYIQLQNIYRDRANADAEEVFKRVQNHLEAIGRQPVRQINEIFILIFALKLYCYEEF